MIHVGRSDLYTRAFLLQLRSAIIYTLFLLETLFPLRRPPPPSLSHLPHDSFTTQRSHQRLRLKPFGLWPRELCLYVSSY